MWDVSALNEGHDPTSTTETKHQLQQSNASIGVPNGLYEVWNVVPLSCLQGGSTASPQKSITGSLNFCSKPILDKMPALGNDKTPCSGVGVHSSALSALVCDERPLLARCSLEAGDVLLKSGVSHPKRVFTCGFASVRQQSGPDNSFIGPLSFPRASCTPEGRGAFRQERNRTANALCTLRFP